MSVELIETSSVHRISCSQLFLLKISESSWRRFLSHGTNSRWYYSEDVAHAERKIGFVTSFDLIKCLEQIKKQILLLTCAHISEFKGSRKKVPFFNGLATKELEQ